MDPSQWTQKTSSAFSAAADAAQVAGHPQVEPLHVALTALEDAAGIARAAVLRAASGDEAAVASLRRTLARASSRLPAVRPPPDGTPSVSPALANVLRKAGAHMKQRGDSFLAVDTLWLACLEDSKVRDLLGCDAHFFLECSRGTLCRACCRRAHAG
jgi:ATP-dependent Clp protease ATP-binding subunit ClpB